jgi:hypothetical protein
MNEQRDKTNPEETSEGAGGGEKEEETSLRPAPPVTPTPTPQDDPFDFDRLRLPQDFAETSVKKVIVSVPVRKPDRQSFVRVHPDQGQRLETGLLTLREEREVYIVDRSMWAALGSEVVPTILFTAITRSGDVFLWPVKHPGADVRPNEFNRTMYEGAQRAMRIWVRVAANMSLGAYDVRDAEGHIPDPIWPDITFKELLKIAFQGRVIRTLDHPVIQRLHGKI